MRKWFNAVILTVLLCVCAAFAAPRQIAHLALESCCAIWDPVDAARVSSINPEYSLIMGDWTYWSNIALTPDTNTWTWTNADIEVNYEYSQGRKIIHRAFCRPDWQTNDATFIQDYCVYLNAFYSRYKGKIFACCVWNEPTYLDPVAEHWGYLPGCSNNDEQVAAFLPKLYKAARETVKAADPQVLIVGPDWESPLYTHQTGLLWANGAGKYLDVFSFHDYWGAVRHPDQTWTNPADPGFIVPPIDVSVERLRNAMRKKVKPIWCTELGLFGRSSSSAVFANSGPYCSGFSVAQGINDARNYAILLRKAKVEVIMPYCQPFSTPLIQASWRNFEINGYEFDDGSYGDATNIPMKLKTSVFLNTLSGLTGK